MSGTGEVNCLANAVAISLLWVRDLEEKAMGRLEGMSVCLQLRDSIMPHKRFDCFCGSRISLFKRSTFV